MTKMDNLINTVLKAVALGLAVATLVFGFMEIGDMGARISLLGMSVFALALVALRKDA